MCGIAGVALLPGKQLSPEIVEKLFRSLAHRGPDGSGREMRGGVALIHTRLAIIDLENGSQPISDGNSLSLVANGEIYNNKELRMAFAAKFTTQSDCEPPLMLYKKFGNKFVDHMRGMWGVALHDSDCSQLVLSRDPFGIKPLYYAETSIGVIFASEAQAIMQTEFVNLEINNHVRDELLNLQFTTGSDTIYKGIRRVLPGEVLSIRQGKIYKRYRKAALPNRPIEVLDQETALNRLDKVLLESVELHQRSAVPYGMCLSGGIDSTSLLIAMSRLSNDPVSAYTLGFDTSSVANETEHAAKMAKLVGAKHQAVLMGENDFWSMLQKVVAVLDDPVIDYATLPTYKLAELAGRELKVVLSGEGGDELFGGYGRYLKSIRPWWQGGRRPMRSYSALSRLDILRNKAQGWRDGIVKAEKEASISGRSALQVVQAVDCIDWLPNDLLLKLDRCLMAHGVEGRTPFLDPSVASLAFCLPDHFKVRGGLGKWLLRKWLDRELPESAAFERKKGFTVPIGEWINSLAKTIAPLVERQQGIQELCLPGKIPELFECNSPLARNASWILLFYSLWHNYHVLGRDIGENIGDALALN